MGRQNRFQVFSYVFISHSFSLNHFVSSRNNFLLKTFQHILKTLFWRTLLKNINTNFGLFSSSSFSLLILVMPLFFLLFIIKFRMQLGTFINNLLSIKQTRGLGKIEFIFSFLFMTLFFCCFRSGVPKKAFQ